MRTKENIDMRIIKTKRNLINAFIDIAKTKNINLISVNEIVKKAEVSRGTFYLHYENKDDFIETISNEMLEEFVLWVKRAQKINSIRSESFNDHKPRDTFFAMFKFIKEHREFFYIMLGTNGSTSFRDEMKNTIKNKVYKELMDAIIFEGKSLVDPEILLEFTCTSCLGIIIWWLDSNMEKSPEYLADELTKISILGPIKARGIIK